MYSCSGACLFLGCLQGDHLWSQVLHICYYLPQTSYLNALEASTIQSKLEALFSLREKNI